MKEKNSLIYSELSYRVIGCAYEVFNSIGGGHKEIVYQKAMSMTVKAKGLGFEEQYYYPVVYKGKVVGKNFFDLFVEGKVLVEFKSSSKFTKANYDQVLNYLRVSNIQLALLIAFGANEVRCKRVVNFPDPNPNNMKLIKLLDI